MEPNKALVKQAKQNRPAPAAGNGDAERTVNGETVDVHELLHALTAMRVGDFSVRLPSDRIGIAGKIADTFNEIVAANQRMAQQLDRVGAAVGREGKTRNRVKFGLTRDRKSTRLNSSH